MKKEKGISQEALKVTAMISMLIDHASFLLPSFYQETALGQVQVPVYRMIGRLAFPIYCFLLVEGFHHTKNRARYGLRLLFAALLSELPYDLKNFFGWSWAGNNVLFTLLLGFLALSVMEWQGNKAVKLTGLILLAGAGELLRCDYGTGGVLLILLFGITYHTPHERLFQLMGMLLIFAAMQSPGAILIWSRSIKIQYFAIFALIPISLYSERKCTNSKAIQWSFYLFYPVHLLVLYGIILLQTSF